MANLILILIILFFLPNPCRPSLFAADHPTSPIGQARGRVIFLLAPCFIWVASLCLPQPVVPKLIRATRFDLVLCPAGLTSMPLLGRTSPEPFARPNTPGSLEPTPYREAFEACQFLLARFFHIELESTARATPYENQGLAFEILPHTFNRMVTTAEPQERGNVTYGIYMGMMSLANAYPIHIDSFLQIYLKAVELSPSDQGDASLSFQIFMNMGETCNTGYRTNDFWTQPVIYRPGTLDPLDSSNLNFTEEDIEGNLSNVLRTSQRQAHEGNDYIVRAAMFARFGVFMKETHPFCINGYRIEECLRKETVGGRWIKAELIATLVRLRGYAKSLSEKFAAEEGTYSRLNEWQRLLRRWLYDPELNMTNDPMVKYHVLLTIKNLRDGPFDETSSEIFYARDWVL